MISANACGRQLVLSTTISNQDIFMVAMKAIITDNAVSQQTIAVLILVNLYII